MEDCIELKKRFPHLIAGFDLVGHGKCKLSRTHLTDKRGRAGAVHYIPSFALVVPDEVQGRGRRHPIRLPRRRDAWRWHQGRSKPLRCDPSRHEAYRTRVRLCSAPGHSAIADSRRFSMIKHPKLMKTCQEKGIAIEVCPISCVTLFPLALLRLTPVTGTKSLACRHPSTRIHCPASWPTAFPS